MFSAKKKKKKDKREVTDVLTKQTGGILSRCLCLSNHQDIYFKYLPILSVLSQKS